MRRESSPELGEAWEKFGLPRSAGALELNLEAGGRGKKIPTINRIVANVLKGLSKKLETKQLSWGIPGISPGWEISVV